MCLVRVETHFPDWSVNIIEVCVQIKTMLPDFSGWLQAMSFLATIFQSSCIQ